MFGEQVNRIVEEMIVGGLKPFLAQPLVLILSIGLVFLGIYVNKNRKEYSKDEYSFLKSYFYLSTWAFFFSCVASRFL